jgi:hypothetical protein
VLSAKVGREKRWEGRRGEVKNQNTRADRPGWLAGAVTTHQPKGGAMLSQSFSRPRQIGQQDGKGVATFLSCARQQPP